MVVGNILDRRISCYLRTISLIGLASCATAMRSTQESIEPSPLNKIRPLLVQPIQITVGNDANLNPDLSEDSRYLAYTTSINGNKEVTIRDRQKGSLVRLTWHPADDFSPVISPDGDSIAFITRRQDAAGDVAITPRSSLASRALSEGDVTVFSDSSSEELTPAWWPDGKSLLVPSKSTKEKTPTLRRLTVNDGKWDAWGGVQGDFPQISPDGKSVAYVRNGRIFLNSESGTNERELAGLPSGIWSRPRFSANSNLKYGNSSQTLVAVRYQHDTNKDRKINGSDNGVIWEVIYDKANGNSIESYQLTSASLNAFSPELKLDGLFVTLQAKGGLEIYRLPYTGQSRLEWSHTPQSKWLNFLPNSYDRLFALNSQAESLEVGGKLKESIAVKTQAIQELAAKGMVEDVAIATDDLRKKLPTDTRAILIADALDLYSLAMRDALVLISGKAGIENYQRLSKYTDQLMGLHKKASSANSSDLNTPSLIALYAASINQITKNNDKSRKILDMISPSSDKGILDQAKLVEAELIGESNGAPAKESYLKEILLSRNSIDSVLRQSANMFVKSIEKRNPDNEELTQIRQDTNKTVFLPPLLHEIVAKRFLNQKKNQIAVQEYRQILEDHCQTDPAVTLQLAEAYIDAAMAFGNHEEIDDSLSRLQECVRSSEDALIESKTIRAKALIRRGIALLRVREFAVGLKVFRLATEVDPSNLGGWRGYIDASFRRNGLEEVLATLKRNYNKSPTNPSAVYAYAYATTYLIDNAKKPASKLSATEESIQLIEKSKDLNPTSIYPYQTLGWLYMQKGHWLKRVRSEGGFFGILSTIVAKSRELFGKPEQDSVELGIDSFLAAINLAEDGSLERANLLQNLGEAYHQLENHQKALLHLGERISLSKVQPFADRSSEASIYRLAGRSAFQIDELELAESIQQKALEIWQTSGNDQQISYSMDALALTLREAKKYDSAIEVYNQLKSRYIAAKKPLEEARTLSNLGYCYYMNRNFDKALISFKESDLALLNLGEPDSIKEGEAIAVDVGGQGSASKGFNIFGIQNMNATFTARIYEDKGAWSQAQEVYKLKLSLLASEIKTRDKKEVTSLKEESLITRNNLGMAYVSNGNLMRALEEFRQTTADARTFYEKEIISDSEALNIAAWARIELRLLSLGVTAGESLKEVTARLAEVRDFLKKQMVDDPKKARFQNIIGRLALPSAFLETHNSANHVEKVTKIKEVLASLETFSDEVLGPPASALELALNGFDSSTSPNTGPLKRRMRSLRSESVRANDSKNSWRFFAAVGDSINAFQNLEKQVESGHVFSSIHDQDSAFRLTTDVIASESDHEKISLIRRLARLYAISFVNATSKFSQDPTKASTVQNANNITKAKSFHLPLISDEALKTILKDDTSAAVVLSSNINLLAAIFSKGAWSFVTTQTIDDLKPRIQGRRVYFTCYGLNCDRIRQSLAEENRRIAVVASPEQIQALRSTTRIARSTVLVLGDRNEVEEGRLKERMADGDISFANGTSWGDLSKNIASSHVTIFNKPLLVGHEKPWTSEIQFSKTNHWPIAESVKFKPFDSTAMLFSEIVSTDNSVDPMWFYSYLSTWLQIQRVPSAFVRIMKRPALTQDHASEPATKDITQDRILEHSLDVLKNMDTTPPKNLVMIGDPGLFLEEEILFSKSRLPVALDEADDARDDDDFPKAKRLYLEASHYAKVLNQNDSVSMINQQLVKTLFQAREYPSALHFQQKRIELLISAKESPEKIAAAQMEAGILATRSGFGSIARKYLNDAETFYLKDQDDEKIPPVYHYIALSYESDGEFQKTIEAYDKSRLLSEKLGRFGESSQKLLDIGNIYKERLSNLPLALDYYDKAYESFQKAGLKDKLVNVQIDRANTLMALGETKWAINVLERRVLNTIDPDDNPRLWIRSAQIVANAYFRAGLFQESQSYLQKIRGLLTLISDETSRANLTIDAENLLAMNLEKIGKHDEATVVFSSALDLAKKFKLRGKESLILSNIGFWAREAGDVARSVNFFQAALAIDIDLRSESDQAFDYRNLAMSWTLLGNLVQAKSAAEKALEMSRRLKIAYNEAYSLFAIAEIHLKQNSAPKALEAFQQAREIASKAYLQDFLWRADAAIANVYASQNNLELAASTYKSAIEIIESLRSGLSSQSSKTGFASDAGVQSVYSDIVRVLMKSSKIEEAWIYSERGRARSFIDALGSRTQSFGDPKIDEALDQERKLRSDVEVLERRLATMPDKSPESFVIKAGLTKARSARETAINNITSQWPRVAPFVNVKKMDLSIVKEKVSPNAAVLEFMILGDQTAFWVIQNGKIKGGLLNVTQKNLASKIDQYRELMQNFGAVKGTARDISNLILLEPLKLVENVTELVIVPHGELHYLPFASLPVNDQDFLVDRFSISYLESAEMLRFSPFNIPTLSRASKLVAFGNPDRGPNLDLPFAEKEVKSIVRNFADAKTYFSKEASKANYISAAQHADIVHFAGHGEFIESNPSESRLLFAGEDNLTVQELFKIRMPVSLVTLSACETGLGKLSSGDEMVGFNRALFFSGASSVVSSLWRVSDVASAVTTKRFYSYLTKGKSKADALRDAQIIVRNYYPHPAYWSAFKLSGER